MSKARGAGLAAGAERLTLAVLLIACAVPLVWPGDVSFINDEPQLIASAVDANARHRLAPIGLMGTVGFQYGPLPVWVYQALLAITPDLVVVATLHTALMVATTAGAVWWLSRSLGLWVWFAPVPLLSPYFWHYARVLWDNPHAIPLGALALAGYAAHLSTGSRAGLRITLASMAGMLLVHLMALALVIPVALHIALVRRRQVMADWMSLSLIGAAALALGWPYWTYLATTSPEPAAGDASGYLAWVFPLRGGRLLSANRLDYFFGSGPVSGGVMNTAVMASRVSFPLVWCGLAVAAWTVWTARARAWTPRDHIALILIGSLTCQVLIDGLTGKYHHPHYHNATWIVSVLLAWIALDTAAHRSSPLRWSAFAVAGVLAMALATSTAILAVRLHRTGGTRETYGPTLSNQQRVAREVARYSASSRVSADGVWLYQLFPHTLAILRQLNAGPNPALPARDLEIRYATSNPAVGTIELVER